jgi:hypothetical protein
MLEFGGNVLKMSARPHPTNELPIIVIRIFEKFMTGPISGRAGEA